MVAAVRAVMRDKRVVNRLKLRVIPSIRHGALDQFADAVADKHAHLVHRVRRQTVFRQRRVCARRQIIQRVEQRAIQIPNRRFDIHVLHSFPFSRLIVQHAAVFVKCSLLFFSFCCIIEI